MEISELKPLTYSIILNKNNDKQTVLNLEKLVTEFKLDIKLEDNIPHKTNASAFISKSFYQIQNLDKPDKTDFSYNYPPKGPIETNFICLYCKKEGPNYHKENCRRPFNSSLVLSRETTRFPGAEEGTEYELIVKKSGQKKIVSKRARSETFTDNVEIYYENEYTQRCIIRVSRTGTINIISASLKSEDEDLPSLLVYRINQTNAVVNPPFKILSTHIYLIQAQFNITKNKELLVNLNILHTNLWTIPLFKKKVGGKDVFMIGDESYIVNNYNYNSGEQYSRSNKMTNPYIQFNLIKGNIKTHVQIYIRGAVQLRSSYINPDIGELTFDILENVYQFLKELLREVIIYSSESGYSVITSEIKSLKKSKIPNMVDGTQPKMCHNRPGTTAGSGDYRPVPYSFYGVCPMEGYYVKGIRRPDGKYEPCCRKLKSDPSSPDYIGRYKNMMLNGYPDPQAAIFGETVTPGDSAVYVPGTKIVESRSFKGLNNMSKKELFDYMEATGYIREANIFDKDKKLTNFTFKKIKTLTNLDIFTKNVYMVTPINNDTIKVKLYFDENGKSFFINVLNESVPFDFTLPELKLTEIEGYLEMEKLTFYPYDILVYKGKDISENDFYHSAGKRWDYLKKAIDLIKVTNPFQIEMNFDLNIVQGSNYYLQNENISGLLFIPTQGKEMRIWSDTFHDANSTVALNVQKISGNRWKISVNGTTISNSLVQQGPNNDIEIPVSFTKNKGNNLIILFKINLKQTDFKIENRKPFIPLEILDEQINDHAEVVSILESINNPISREVFNLSDPPGFTYLGKIYYFTAINKPLTIV